MSIFSNVTTGVLTVCAVVVTAAVVRREVFPRFARERAHEARTIKDWEPLAQAGHTLGPENATVRILEFSDFQCPFCRSVQLALRQVRSKYPDQVSVTYRHFPLEALHPFAFKAPLASECAAVQGQFEPFHDALFAGQSEIGIRSWEDYAIEARVPAIADFTKCIEAGALSDRVQRDFDAARDIDLGGTPSIIVNGKLLPGTPSAIELGREVDQALATAGKQNM
jgi:protein-disulfide isomerase